MDPVALGDQAMAAANKLLDEYARGVIESNSRAKLAALIAIAWLEGRQAGGDEARALIAQFQKGL